VFFRIEKFTHKEGRGNVALHVAARGVSMDVGFGFTLCSQRCQYGCRIWLYILQPEVSVWMSELALHIAARGVSMDVGFGSQLAVYLKGVD
jgi:hypothetical protein